MATATTTTTTSNIPSTISIMTNPTEEDMPTMREVAHNPREEQILTYASSVHQICMSDNHTALTPALSILKELMESLSQAVMRSTLQNNVLEVLASQTKRVFTQLTKLSKLPPLLLLVERPTLLTHIYNALQGIQQALMSQQQDHNTALWEAQTEALNALIQQSKIVKNLLLKEDDLFLQLTQASTATDPARTELLQLLERKKRVLFKESVHQHREVASQQEAKQELQYLELLLQKVHVLIEQQKQQDQQDTQMDTSMNLMDASVMSLSLPDNSSSKLSPAALPAWAVCPVSKQILMDPVTVRADCQHTLSKSIFQEWLNRDNKTCPVCGCKLKALYAKANPQLQWKLQQWQHETSHATLAGAVVVPTTTSNTTRRFSTGDFTSRRTVVGATKKSATENAPMALRGEGTKVNTASTSSTNTTTVGAQPIQEDEEEEPTTNNHMNDSSAVQFSPTVVTNYIDQTKAIPTTHVDTKKEHVSSYTMIDRSKLGKKKHRNPVKNLLSLLGGSNYKNHHHNNKANLAVAKIKVTQYNHNNGMNGSSTSHTITTIDLSGGESSGGEHARLRHQSTHSSSSSSEVVSILKRNGKHSSSSSGSLPQAPPSTSRASPPPPLIPMKA